MMRAGSPQGYGFDPAFLPALLFLVGCGAAGSDSHHRPSLFILAVVIVIALDYYRRKNRRARIARIRAGIEARVAEKRRKETAR
jgi:hypothetical protein